MVECVGSWTVLGRFCPKTPWKWEGCKIKKGTKIGTDLAIFCAQTCALVCASYRTKLEHACSGFVLILFWFCSGN